MKAMQDGGLTPSFSEVIDALESADVKKSGSKIEFSEERFIERLQDLARRRYIKNAAEWDGMKANAPGYIYGARYHGGVVRS